MNTITTECCDNCLYCEREEPYSYDVHLEELAKYDAPVERYTETVFSPPKCRRYPKAVAVAFYDWCGEYKAAYMPVDESKKKDGRWWQPYVHRRTGALVFKNNKTGECQTEEEYRAT